jgi:hypothetical protein
MARDPTRVFGYVVGSSNSVETNSNTNPERGLWRSAGFFRAFARQCDYRIDGHIILPIAELMENVKPYKLPSTIMSIK